MNGMSDAKDTFSFEATIRGEFYGRATDKDRAELLIRNAFNNISQEYRQGLSFDDVNVRAWKAAPGSYAEQKQRSDYTEEKLKQ